MKWGLEERPGCDERDLGHARCTGTLSGEERAGGAFSIPNAHVGIDDFANSDR